MLDFVMLANRQGKVRMVRWYHPALTQGHRHRITADLPNTVISRSTGGRSKGTDTAPSIFDWHAPSYRHTQQQPVRIVYRRYASLYFILALDPRGNPLHALDLIHALVESLDKYFGSVCELDLVFDFHKTAYVIDEWWCGGRVAVGGEGKGVVVAGCREADEQERLEKEEARAHLAIF